MLYSAKDYEANISYFQKSLSNLKNEILYLESYLDNYKQLLKNNQALEQKVLFLKKELNRLKR